VASHVDVSMCVCVVFMTVLWVLRRWEGRRPRVCSPGSESTLRDGVHPSNGLWRRWHARSRGCDMFTFWWRCINSRVCECFDVSPYFHHYFYTITSIIGLVIIIILIGSSRHVSFHVGNEPLALYSFSGAVLDVSVSTCMCMRDWYLCLINTVIIIIIIKLFSCNLGR
jgi:hypothetical protein